MKKLTDDYGDTIEVGQSGDMVYVEVGVNSDNAHYWLTTDGVAPVELTVDQAFKVARQIVKAALKAARR